MGKFTSLFHPQPGGWNTGLIVTRAFAGDLSQEEYQRMQRGTRRLPDSYTADGVPVYHLSDSELLRAQRLLDRECSDRRETYNVACNAGRSNVLNYIGNIVDNGVRYFSVGTGVGTPAASDTTMFNDFFRKSPSTVTLTGNQVLIATSFATSEGNTTYTEAGLIGGSTAVVTVGGAGTLFAHSSYSYTKNSSITLTNDYFIFLN